MDPAALVDLAGGGAAEVRESPVVFAGTEVLTEPDTLGREDTGAFFAASVTEALGRAAGAAEPAFDDATDPVGEATEPRRAAPSVEGLALAEADKEGLTDDGAAVFVGTTDALRVAVAGATDGLLEADEAREGLDAAGADVVGFFNGGAVAFDAAVAVDDAGFDAAGLTAPAPNVPELITYMKRRHSTIRLRNVRNLPS